MGVVVGGAADAGGGPGGLAARQLAADPRRGARDQDSAIIDRRPCVPGHDHISVR